MKGSIFDNGFDLLALLRRAAFQRVDHRHGDFAFAQIAGHWLAQNIFRGSEIENVIHDLECHSQIAAVLRARFSSCSGVAPPRIAPIFMHTENRHAVLR